MATDELGSLSKRLQGELHQIMQLLYQNALRSVELMNRAKLKKDKFRIRMKTLVLMGLVNEIPGRMSITYELTEKGRVYVEKPAQESIDSIEEAGASTKILDFDKKDWKFYAIRFVEDPTRNLFMTSIGSKALKDIHFRNIAYVQFRKLKIRGIDVRLIVADGFFDDETKVWLKELAITTGVIDIKWLNEIAGVMTPFDPRIKDLCHIMVMDGKHWLWTETTRNGMENSMKGWCGLNHRKVAENLEGIFESLWKHTTPMFPKEA